MAETIFEIEIDKKIYKYPPDRPTEISDISAIADGAYAFTFKRKTQLAGTGKPGNRHILQAKTREYTGQIVDGPTVRILRLDQTV